MKFKFFLVFAIFLFSSASVSFAASPIKIVINGNEVEFNDSTGYPYVDESNRTMVPLRVTMETAGATVGYDSTNKTAIVIISNHRLEIPIGTNLIYDNGNEVLNDTDSVAKNGITYLPIRAVFESADYTVEWDSNTSTVNAYNLNSASPTNENIISINVKLYFKPKRDINDIIAEQEIINNITSEPLNIDWISQAEYQFDKIMMRSDKIKADTSKLEEGYIDSYFYIYAFYDSGITGDTTVYEVPEMTDEFMGSSNAEGTFNDIRMKKEDGELYFKVEDLIKYGLFEE